MKQIARKSKKAEFQGRLVSSMESYQELHALDLEFLTYLGTIHQPSSIGRIYAMDHKAHLVESISDFTAKYVKIETDIRTYNNKIDGKPVPDTLDAFEYFPASNVLAYLAIVDIKSNMITAIVRDWTNQLHSMNAASHQIKELMAIIGSRSGLISNPLVRVTFMYQSHAYH